MGSAPPDPTEFHKLTFVLDGVRLKGSKKQRATKYYDYLKEMKKLAAKYGAKLHTKELHLKQSTINERKRKIKKLLRGG